MFFLVDCGDSITGDIFKDVKNSARVVWEVKDNQRDNPANAKLTKLATLKSKFKRLKAAKSRKKNIRQL